MLGPVVYVFLWMTIFGGSGLRMEREAAESELCCHNVNMSRMSELVDILGDGKINLRPVYYIMRNVNFEDTYFRDNLCDSACNSCSVKLLGARANLTYDQFQDEISLFTKPDW